MKPDVEGEYVADIIARERDVPRSLPNGSLLRLYLLPPNSRYYVFVGFFFLALAGLMFLFQLQGAPYAESISIGIAVGLLLVLVAFGLPLVNLRQMMHAVQFGVSALGRVESAQNARTTPYSTPEGMRHGAKRAVIAYTAKGQEHSAEVFLDRPWVDVVERGTQLRLLIDPDKPSILFVVGIAEQQRKG